MAVKKRGEVQPMDLEAEPVTTGVYEVDEDTEADNGIPSDYDYLDADPGATYTMKMSESFTWGGRNHIVVFDGTATLRDGEHYAALVARLADQVIYGLQVSKDIFIATKRQEKQSQGEDS